MTPFDNLRDYRAPRMDEAVAGAIIGVIVAALVLWDVVQRIAEWVK